ncbi:MAG: hypothetical protein IPP90_23005 [Gemmatimonadaceae bacterium]|nr:hypothetical protein [Gemmatimonadaceae bacterium]
MRLSPELSLRLTTARWLRRPGAPLERRQGTGSAATGGMQPDVLLDDATWRDPSGVPREWPSTTIGSLVAAADSVAMTGLREGWATTSVATLESRLRQQLSAQIPRRLSAEVGSARWVGVATRLATVRMFEVHGMDEALLRYAMREDVAMHAGLDVLAPGIDATRVIPTELPHAPRTR